MEYKKLNSFIKSLDNLKSFATSMFQMNEDEFRQSYLLLALQMEKLTDKVRTATVVDADIDRDYYIFKAAEELNISIRKHKNKIIIVLPYLLPKRQSVASDSYIVEPLASVLKEYIDTNKPKKLECPLVEIKSVYSPENKKIIRDNDNIEVRHVINIISTMLFVDDNNMDLLLCSRSGDSTYTEITVSERKKRLKSAHIHDNQNAFFKRKKVIKRNS